MGMSIAKLYELHSLGMNGVMEPGEIHRIIADPNTTNDKRNKVIYSLEECYKKDERSGDYVYLG